MAQLPNTNELYTSQIPALQVLMKMKWNYISAHDCMELRGKNNRNVIIKSILINFLKEFTYSFSGSSYPLSNNSIEQIIREVESLELHNGLAVANEKMYNKLTLGITVKEFTPTGKALSITVPLIDFTNTEKNFFHVTEELEVQNITNSGTRRPDVVCYVNGIPLVIIEAKRPVGSSDKPTIQEGISQNIRNQKDGEIPHLFVYSQLLMSINNIDGRYATTKTPATFWAKWTEEEILESEFSEIKNSKLTQEQKDELYKDKDYYVKKHYDELYSQEVAVTDQDRMIVSLLKPSRLLNFIQYFLIFDKKKGKIAARYQQYFGVKQLLERISTKTPEGAREGGVIWHTTGSGKSFTMLYLTKALALEKNLQNCRVIIVTDRVDLEEQLSKTFMTGGAFGSEQATKKDGETSRASSGKQLAARIGHGNERIIFTLVHKFQTATKYKECHNDSENIIVLVDEGHRTQNGETAQRMRNALPNAAFVAFTGTPLLKKDKTQAKFGSIIHSYTMQKAVEDKTVAPLVYEERRPELDQNEKAIDSWFERVTINLTDSQKVDLKKKYATKGKVYGAENRISLIAWDISMHFKANFKDLDLGLKGQLATDSKLSAIRYKKALDEIGLVTSKVVISKSDTRDGHSTVDEDKLPEVQEWWSKNIKGDEREYENKALDDFSTPGEPDILIVVSRLLTGFDEPRNAVLYIDKPLKEHTLIQAIARVNRLHDSKKFGFLVDYRGILKELDTAIDDYKELAEKTDEGYDLKDIDGLYKDINTEYKKLPHLYKTLKALFKNVKNKQDIEQYRQLLIPRFEQKDDLGIKVDKNQKLRDDFYESLTEFGMCLQVALSSSEFYQDSYFSESVVGEYKQALKFFSELRKLSKQDSGETVDFSIYEEQVNKLVDRHVVANNIDDSKGSIFVNYNGKDDAPENWTDEKLKNEKAVIESRVTKTIDEKLNNDPYAKKYFSELLKETIAQINSLFDSPYEQYNTIKNFEKKVNSKDIETTPEKLKDNNAAKAYYGVFKLVLDNISDNVVDYCLEIDLTVKDIISENTLNTENIESEVRKSLIMKYHKEVEFSKLKEIIDQIINIIKINIVESKNGN